MDKRLKDSEDFLTRRNDSVIVTLDDGGAFELLPEHGGALIVVEVAPTGYSLISRDIEIGFTVEFFQKSSTPISFTSIVGDDDSHRFKGIAYYVPSGNVYQWDCRRMAISGDWNYSRTRLTKISATEWAVESSGYWLDPDD